MLNSDYVTKFVPREQYEIVRDVAKEILEHHLHGNPDAQAVIRAALHKAEATEI